jgi:type 1 glutamine amidotransferase
VRIPGALLALLLALPALACGEGEDESGLDVLVFSRTTAYRHAEAIEAGREVLEERFEAEATEDPARFSDDVLEDVDVVVLLHTNGPGVLTGDQRAAFQRWVEGGGGVVAIHAAANADRDWPFYGEVLGGARFRNHPPGELQFQKAQVVIEDRLHPATERLPPRWEYTDEWYNFAPEPGPAAHVLATLDEGTYEEDDGTAAEDRHPIAWCTRVGGGRSLYTALGHGAEAWAEPLYRAHVLGAVRSVAQVTPPC